VSPVSAYLILDNSAISRLSETLGADGGGNVIALKGFDIEPSIIILRCMR